jgi:hypothetical protein
MQEQGQAPVLAEMLAFLERVPRDDNPASE